MAGELLELVTSHDPTLQKRVTARVCKVIHDSFADKSRMTASEAARRFKIVEQLVRELRAGHGWAFERILDAMPYALRCRLDGIAWDPMLHRNSWSD